MAPSVLGKRTRNSVYIGKSNPPEAAESVASRVKRRATTAVFSDKDLGPLDSPQSSYTTSYDVDSTGWDDIVEAKSITVTPEKGGSRLAQTPAKVKTHFDTINSSNVENEDPLQLCTPQTPRHRDVSKKIPITPRHRFIVAGRSLTPRTPRTPSSLGSTYFSVYNAARQLFARSMDPKRLIGREDERETLQSFINTRISSTSGGCMYVSGPPGTGKTALVQEVTSEIQSDSTLKKAYVNCMSMASSSDIYTTLLGALCEDAETLKDDAMRALQGLFLPRKQSSTVYLVILDEVDHILTINLEALYKIFEWSLQKSSRLILIGIANALDLTDRFLPRLKARTHKPCLLPMLPYNASQIKGIIITKLKSLVPANCTDGNFVPFIHPAAIELCSRKVSSQTGDLRKAFDICRRAIELIESETKQKHQQALNEQAPSSPSKTPLAENANLSSSENVTQSQQKLLTLSLGGLTVETAPRACISHINKITSMTLGNGTNQRLNILNLQQKAALCALVARERRQRVLAMDVMATPSKSRVAAPTVKALYGTYSTLCKRDSILHPLTSIEFRDVIASLETLSLVSAVEGKNGSLVLSNTPSKRGRKAAFGSGAGAGDEKRVVSSVSEKELRQAIQGPGASILISILNGEGFD